MADPNVIAETKVVIGADISGVKNAIPEVKKELQDAGDAAETTGTRMSGAFGDVGQKIEDSTAGLRKFTGALSSTVGAVTAVTGAITGLAGILLLLKNRHDAAEEAARKQRSAYNDLIESINEYSSTAVTSTKEAEEGFRRVAEAIDAQNGVVERARLDALFATARQVEAEKVLEGQIADTKEAYRLRTEAVVEDARRQAEAIEQISELLETQRISLLPDDQKLQADAERQKRIIQDAFSGIVLPPNLLEDALANIDRITQKQLEAERERQRIADEAQAAREAEADRRSQERAQREVETIRQGLESITAGEFTTVLESIPRVLQDVSSKLGRLK